LYKFFAGVGWINVDDKAVITQAQRKILCEVETKHILVRFVLR